MEIENAYGEWVLDWSKPFGEFAALIDYLIGQMSGDSFSRDYEYFSRENGLQTYGYSMASAFECLHNAACAAAMQCLLDNMNCATVSPCNPWEIENARCCQYDQPITFAAVLTQVCVELGLSNVPVCASALTTSRPKAGDEGGGGGDEGGGGSTIIVVVVVIVLALAAGVGAAFVKKIGPFASKVEAGGTTIYQESANSAESLGGL
jgi:hypothetical protein